jgi:nucleoside-diphosphate-sugar epimerase
MRVLVTGADGFVGRRVVAELARRGHDVSATSRNGREGTVAIGDMTCIDDWSSITRPFDAIVHLAALAHRLGSAQPSDAAYMLANATVPERIARSLRGSRSRLVFMSSAGAVCQSSEAIVSDSTAPTPTSRYGRSKLEAEERVKRTLSDGVADYVILRPPLVYGEGNPGNMARLVTAVRRGRWIPHDLARRRRSLIYVGNLASAVATAVESRSLSRGCHLLCDGEHLTVGEIVTRIASALAVPPRLVGVPHRVLSIARGACALAGTIGLGPARNLADAFDRLSTSLVIDDGNFRRITGWIPHVDGSTAFLRSFGP